MLGMITQTAAYVVPFDALKRAAGSRDQKLFETISEGQADLLDEADANRDEEGMLSCRKALAHLIDGVPTRVKRSDAPMYGLALEAMCAQLGEFAGQVYGDWNDELDELFAEQGVPLKYSALVFGDEVIKLPAHEGYPEIGSWTPEVVAAVARPLRAINLDELQEEDEELAEAVGEVVGWIKKARKRRGWGVVGFSL
jgi:hypothetical protein